MKTTTIRLRVTAIIDVEMPVEQEDDDSRAPIEVATEYLEGTSIEHWWPQLSADWNVEELNIEQR